MLRSLTSCETGDSAGTATGFGSDERARHWAELVEAGVSCHKNWRTEVTILCISSCWRASSTFVVFGATCSIVMVISSSTWDAHLAGSFGCASIAICYRLGALSKADSEEDQDELKNIKFHFVFMNYL